MSPAAFAALRRRLLNDAGFRARLGASFAHTLAEEGLLGKLTSDQMEEIFLSMRLYQAMHGSAARELREEAEAEVAAEAQPAPIPWVQRAALFGQKAPARPARPRPRPGPTAPVSLEDWRRRRAAGGLGR